MCMVQEHTAYEPDSIKCVDEPLLLPNHPAVEKWQTNPQAQFALCNFAGSFAKEAEKVADRRAQKPLFAKLGLEEYEEMWAAVLRMVAPECRVVASTLKPPLDSITSRPWNYGYLANFMLVSQTPNGLPMLKLLADGAARWFLLDLAEVAAHLRSSAKVEKLSLTAAREFFFEKLTPDTITDMGKSRPQHPHHLAAEGQHFVCSSWMDMR